MNKFPAKTSSPSSSASILHCNGVQTYKLYPLISSPPPLSHLSPHAVGQLLKAAECAATYLSMAPSDEVMLHNIRYFTNNYKLRSEDFVPREVSRPFGNV